VVHSGGIFASLSETTGETIIEGMKAAKRQGAICSFDLNFREKLWNIWEVSKRRSRWFPASVANADVLVGNEEDLQKGLGISGQDGREEVQAGFERVLLDDRQGDGEIPAGEGRGHHLA